MSKRKDRKITQAEEAMLTELEAGRTYAEIAKAAGIEEEEVRLRALKILDEVDRLELLKRFPLVYTAAEGVEGLDPTKDVIQVSKQLGMSKALVDGIRRRLLTREGMPADVKSMTDREFVAALKQRAAEILSFMDPYVMSGASLKDLEGALDGVIKNIQLLEGKPTSITSHEDRRQMNELIPALLDEARKRGLTLPIDVKSERIPPPVTVVQEEK